MALSEEQRVMLQLLLERGQSYEDLASLLGVGVGEVRVRARSALKEVCGEDPDREVGLTDYLLGQADPITRADVARHLGSDPGTNSLAVKLEAQLRLIAPEAKLPALPKAPRPAQKEGARAAGTQAGKPRAPGSLSARQRGLIAALLAGLAVVAVGVLIAAGAFDGDDGGSESTASSDGPSSASATASSNANKLTKAVLTPLEGSTGRGVAFFFRQAKKKAPEIQLTAVDLDQLSNGQAYYVWLFKSEKLALPIGGFIVDGKGRGGVRIPIPIQAAALVANGTFNQIDVTLTRNADYRSAVAAAAKGKTIPQLIGKSVMRGKISGPLVGAAKRLSGSSG